MGGGCGGGGAAGQGGTTEELQLLGQKGGGESGGAGVRWEEYIEGGELRFRGHRDSVTAIVECDGRICSGSDYGSTRVWSRASGEHERTLQGDTGEEDEKRTLQEDEDEGDGVIALERTLQEDADELGGERALAVWEGRR